MFNKIFKILAVIALVSLLIPMAPAALAQDAVACEEDYSVQADDWLSKLSDKFYGDVLAYPAIFEATNAAAQADDSYATIANPDLIEVGWKLCILDLMISIILAGVISILLIMIKVKSRKDTVPFGPFIVAGTFLVLMWGDSFLNWYLNFL